MADISEFNINKNRKREEKFKINKEFILYAKHDNLPGVIELLDKKRVGLKPDVNFKGENDWTALHYAAYNGSLKMTNLLLYQEAIIDYINVMKQTPLIIASQR